MPKITFRVEEGILKAARQYAAKKNLSVNALVSEFLNNLAAHEDRTKRDRLRLRQLSGQARVKGLQVEAYAVEVFCNTDKAANWMREPNPTLRGRRPIDLLDSEEGLQEVEDVLTRIESGTYG